MSDVILRILSIIGIILLILLGMVLLSLLLLLFWPVTYRVKGEKTPEKLWVTAKADWLFGFFRVRYAYPEPGSVVVKLLWKTLKDTGQPKKESEENQESGKQKEKDGKGSGAEEKESEAERPVITEIEDTEESVVESESIGTEEIPANSESVGTEESAVNAENEPEELTEDAQEQHREQGKDTPFSRIFEKIKKIKYTILKIYDRIKEVWANISYYIELLREENTAMLWEHVKLRLGKILKNIRPRHIKANVIFGTGAPDTTGYVFGIYSMFLPVLGKKVCLTPDFDQAILEGNIDVSGHITLWTLTWNALKLLLDKKLKLFIKKMKAGRKENGR